MTQQRFDPFADRLSRDIRNTLSKTFIRCLKQGDIELVKREGENFIAMDIAPVYHYYVNNRLVRYQKALDLIQKLKLHDTLEQALILWDQKLFFEVHELLEGVWMKAVGAERKALQGLIRAAGMYVHLEQGNIKAATSMASKAVSALTTYRCALPSFVNLDLLIDKLSQVDPVSPKLSQYLP